MDEPARAQSPSIWRVGKINYTVAVRQSFSTFSNSQALRHPGNGIIVYSRCRTRAILRGML
jgi:hypothetical protein